MAVYIYPAQSVVASNPSVGLNGDPAPLSSTQIAGNDGTDLVPLSVNSAGALALPQGASTSAKQDVGNASLASIDGKVATEAKQDVGNASLSSIDTKVSTAAKQDIGNASLSSIDGKVATATKQDTGNASLANIDSKLTSTVDANNSTITPLAALGIFTGTATDIKDFSTISVLVASDVAAAAGGFSFQFSNDGTNWDHVHNFNFAGGNLSYNISAEARYFRIVYTNDVAPQTYFRLQTVLHRQYIMPSQYTVSQPVTDYNLSTVTKGVIYGKTTGGGGGYVAVKVNPSGALTVDSTVTSSALPTGAATEATLADIKTSVQLLDNAVSGNELQVDVVTSALPTGAATETTLQSIEADTTALAGTVSSGKVLVDGSGVTQPISAASLPLPTGAATESTLSALNQRLGGSLTPVRFDEIALTYVSSGNGAGEIQTAVFKLATVTVRTLTLSYDSSNRLSGVVAT